MYLLAVIILLSGAVAALVLMLNQAPSCQDGKLNQGELEVDCGGPCSAVCPQETKPLTILWSRTFKVTEGKYDLAAMVENPNDSIVASQARYSFKVYDGQNLLLLERQGTVSVNPRQRTVIFIPNVLVGQKIPSRGFTEFISGPDWVRLKDDFIPPELLVIAKNLEAAADSPRLSAIVRNNSVLKLSNVFFYALVADEKRNVIAVSSTVVPQFAPGETKTLFFTWPQGWSQEGLIVDVLSQVDYASL